MWAQVVSRGITPVVKIKKTVSFLQYNNEDLVEVFEISPPKVYVRRNAMYSNMCEITILFGDNIREPWLDDQIVRINTHTLSGIPVRLTLMDWSRSKIHRERYMVECDRVTDLPKLKGEILRIREEIQTGRISSTPTDGLMSTSKRSLWGDKRYSRIRHTIFKMVDNKAILRRVHPFFRDSVDTTMVAIQRISNSVVIPVSKTRITPTENNRLHHPHFPQNLNFKVIDIFMTEVLSVANQEAYHKIRKSVVKSIIEVSMIMEDFKRHDHFSLILEELEHIKSPHQAETSEENHAITKDIQDQSHVEMERLHKDKYFKECFGKYQQLVYKYAQKSPLQSIATVRESLLHLLE